MFPLCRENDLMCISDWFVDRESYATQDEVPQKHILVATEKQIAFAKSLAKKKGYDAEISPEMTVPEMARFIDHLKTLEDIK
jgi:hypothetical protein